ncbi:SCO7460 family lipoprotein [Streptomyces sp. NBC_00370]|uniref:SCO7460 family lipoprotein n=1 Tax=Streptomyces sp. NBC_00370 TaxID=2975728 RepID=UPI002E25969E
MGGSGARSHRGRRVGARLGALTLALLVGGCGVLGTGGDRRHAAELADRRYPGVLDVVAVRTLFPQAAGSEVSFAVADDPDAVVRLRIDAHAGSCEGKDCAGALDRAVEEGRAQAVALRRITSSFAACGYPALAVDPGLGRVWVAASPTGSTVTRVLAEAGACVRAWAPGRDENGGATAVTSVSVHLVSPAVAARLPAGHPSWPTMMRLTDGKLLTALSKRPYYTATYPVRDGEVDPDSGTAVITRPYTYEKAFGDTVQREVGDRLRRTYPRAEVSTYHGIWQLEPGTVDRLRGYVLFCDGPRADGRLCMGDHAVAVTADPEGHPVGGFRVIRDIGSGPLRLPPL